MNSLKVIKKHANFKDGVVFRTSGICFNLIEKCDVKGGEKVIKKELRKAFGSLGYDKDYPVAHPTLSNEDAYYELPNMWDLKTEYGQNRMKLLKELIKYFKKKVAVELNP